jgi:hypothetical protein
MDGGVADTIRGNTGRYTAGRGAWGKNRRRTSFCALAAKPKACASTLCPVQTRPPSGIPPSVTASPSALWEIIEIREIDY